MADDTPSTPSPTDAMPDPESPAPDGEVAAAASPTPPSPTPPAAAAPSPTTAPDLPPGTVRVVMDFSLGAIQVLRDRGFLTVGQPTAQDIDVAVMGMLTAAWKAGVRAEAPSPPAPTVAPSLPSRPPSPAPAADEAAIAKQRAAYLERLAQVQA